MGGKNRASRDLRGFTIVELLIVIVVIAILAAITIVSYNGITNRAKTVSVQSAVEQAAKKVMTYAIMNTELYPNSLATIDIANSGDITYQYSVNNSAIPSTFCVAAVSGTISYFVNSTNTTPMPGGCALPAPVATSVGTAVNNTTTNTIQLTTSTAIPAGDIIVVALVRGVTGSSTAGSASVSLGAGATGTWYRASAQRTGVSDTNLVVAQVTTTIPSGTLVTVTTSGNSTNRAALAIAGISNVSNANPNATSGQDALGVIGTSSAGANGSTSSLSATTDAATIDPDTMVIGLFGYNSSVSWSLELGATQITTLVTTGGSSDRGLLLGYKVVSSMGIQSLTANAGSSTAISGVVMALEL